MMRHIQRITPLDIISKIPSIQEYRSASAGAQCDLLICAAGFEERATAVAQVRPRISADRLLIINYPTNELDNARSLEFLNELVAASRRLEIRYDKATYRLALNRTLSEFANVDGIRVVVDISGMSSYVLFRTFYALFETLPHCDLTVFYAEASRYYPTEEEWREFYDPIAGASTLFEIAERHEQTKFQSRGVDSVYESELFPGINPDALPTQMVLIPNFSFERMKVMVAFAETQYNSAREGACWILGSPPDDSANGWRLPALGALYQVQDTASPVSTLDPKQTIRVLDDIWEQTYAKRHMVIATLGSKMQHVGTFLFLHMHREVGLVLSEPINFVSGRFSEGIGSTWLMPLGRIEELSALLMSRGTLLYDWASP